MPLPKVCTPQYEYMFLKITPTFKTIPEVNEPISTAAVCPDTRKWWVLGRSGGWRELDAEREWKIIHRQETCSYRPGKPSWRSPTFPPARHLWRIWGFHNFLFFLKGGWQHLVHTAVLHLESNLKRARGRGEERSSLVIKGSRMASVC